MTRESRGMNWYQRLTVKMALQSFHVPDRLHAVCTLAKTGDAQYLPHLLNALHDAHPDVRFLAAKGLRLYGNSCPASYLLPLLLDADTRVRDAAAETLLATRGAQLRELFSLDCASTSPELRIAMLKCFLERYPGTDGAWVLALLDDPNEHVRILAIRSLGVLRMHAALDTLLDKLGTEQSPAVRSQIAETLGAFPEDHVLDALVEILPDADPWLEAAILQALVIMGPAAIPALCALLQHAEVLRRCQAARCLGVIATPAVIEPLVVALTRDHNQDVRKHAILALGRINDPRSIDVLRMHLHDDNPMIRTKAAIALGEMGDAGVVRPLLEALADDETVEKALMLIKKILTVSGKDLSEADLHALSRFDLLVLRIRDGKLPPQVRDLVSAIKLLVVQQTADHHAHS